MILIRILCLTIKITIEFNKFDYTILQNYNDYFMNQQKSFLLQNKRIMKALKQNSIIIQQLNQQFTRLQAELANKDYNTFDSQQRNIAMEKKKLEKDIFILDKEINGKDLVEQENKEDKIKQLLQLQRQIEQIKVTNTNRTKQLQETSNKILLNKQKIQINKQKLQDVAQKFKSVQVFLCNDKNKQKFFKLSEKKKRFKDLIKKGNKYKKQQYLYKLLQLQKLKTRIFSYQTEQTSILQRIMYTTQNNKQLQIKSKRFKTQRVSTDTFSKISNSQSVHKRHSSLGPLKTSIQLQQINEFLEPCDSTNHESSFVDKPFEIKFERKRRVLGQKVRICLNN